MIKYVVSITQKNTILFAGYSKHKWSNCLEDTKHFNRLCDASATKNKFIKRFASLNALPTPPAGYITVDIIKLDLVATVI